MAGPAQTSGRWNPGGRTGAPDSCAFKSLRLAVIFNSQTRTPFQRKCQTRVSVKLDSGRFTVRGQVGGASCVLILTLSRDPRETQAWAQGPSLGLETHMLWTLQTGSCPHWTLSWDHLIIRSVSPNPGCPLVPMFSDVASMVTIASPTPGFVGSLLRTTHFNKAAPK